MGRLDDGGWAVEPHLAEFPDSAPDRESMGSTAAVRRRTEGACGAGIAVGLAAGPAGIGQLLR